MLTTLAAASISNHNMSLNLQFVYLLTRYSIANAESAARQLSGSAAGHASSSNHSRGAVSCLTPLATHPSNLTIPRKALLPDRLSELSPGHDTRLEMHTRVQPRQPAHFDQIVDTCELHREVLGGRNAGSRLLQPFRMSMLIGGLKESELRKARMNSP
jgi:hypothetical protein